MPHTPHMDRFFDLVGEMADRIDTLEDQMEAMQTFGIIKNHIHINNCLLFKASYIVSESNSGYGQYMEEKEDKKIIPLRFMYSGKKNEHVLYLIDYSNWSDVKVTQISSFREKYDGKFITIKQICDISGKTEDELNLKSEERLVCSIDGLGDLVYVD